MTIQQLDVHQFRNIDHQQLICHPQYNVISGDNGAGKTSLLEAMYYLSHGRSFRTMRSTELIQHQHNNFALHAQIQQQDKIIPIGVDRPRHGKTRLKKQGDPVVSIAELSYLLPIKLITATAHQIIINGPKQRRNFLDWGVFHGQHHFLATWKSYRRALQQRNALLKQGAPRQDMTYWEAQLIDSGQLLNDMRQQYLSQLMTVFQTIAKLLLTNPESYRIELQRGWSEQYGLDEALDQHWYRDQKQGYTQVGPHRADLLIYFDQHMAHSVLSQGQLKMLAYALHLSQGHCFQQDKDSSPIYLIDDICSELDTDNQQKVFSIIRSMNAQVFITCIDSSMLPIELKPVSSTFALQLGSVAILNKIKTS